MKTVPKNQTVSYGKSSGNSIKRVATGNGTQNQDAQAGTNQSRSSGSNATKPVHKKMEGDITQQVNNLFTQNKLPGVTPASQMGGRTKRSHAGAADQRTGTFADQVGDHLITGGNIDTPEAKAEGAQFDKLSQQRTLEEMKPLINVAETLNHYPAPALAGQLLNDTPAAVLQANVDKLHDAAAQSAEVSTKLDDMGLHSTSNPSLHKVRGILMGATKRDTKSWDSMGIGLNDNEIKQIGDLLGGENHPTSVAGAEEVANFLFYTSLSFGAMTDMKRRSDLDSFAKSADEYVNKLQADAKTNLNVATRSFQNYRNLNAGTIDPEAFSLKQGDAELKVGDDYYYVRSINSKDKDVYLPLTNGQSFRWRMPADAAESFGQYATLVPPALPETAHLTPWESVYGANPAESVNGTAS